MTDLQGKTVLPYGHWPSTITAERLSASSISLHEVVVDEISGCIYWLESRPQENGRFVIMKHDDASVHEVLPNRFSAHGGVNELGGGSFAVDSQGSIVFVDEETQDIHEVSSNGVGTRLMLKAQDNTRYADFATHPNQHQWIVAAKEDHTEATPETQAYGVKNSLVAIHRDSGASHTIAQGDDFYSSPRFSHDGNHLCWIQWHHPDMPWTGTELFVAKWTDGTLTDVRKIAGRRGTQSVSQPRWTQGDRILFADDRSGFWQLYLYSLDDSSTEAIAIKGLEESEFAIADWKLGSSTFVALDEDTVVASVVTYGASNIVLLDLQKKTYRDLGLPHSDLALSGTGVFRVSSDSFAILGSTSTSSKQLAHVTDVRSTSPKLRTIQTTTTNPLSEGTISKAQHLTVRRTSRAGTVHAFFFHPQNIQFSGPQNTRPPCLIHLHGGPNGSTSPALDLTTQYWTSRGYAVCSINYAGSTGFGRAYREELTGFWGLYDVQDTHDVVQHLCAQGLVAASRVGIYGGSAGGYGTLSALHMYPDDFAGAVSSYGICDVRALQANSYKFESHDVERLILSSCRGGGAQEKKEEEEEDRAETLRLRSPIHFVERIKAPLLILQGEKDVAVLPEQANMMAEEMRRLGRTVRVVEFEGEGHGWLRQDTILRAYLEQEAWWKAHLA